MAQPSHHDDHDHDHDAGHGHGHGSDHDHDHHEHGHDSSHDSSHDHDADESTVSADDLPAVELPDIELPPIEEPAPSMLQRLQFFGWPTLCAVLFGMVMHLLFFAKPKAAPEAAPARVEIPAAAMRERQRQGDDHLRAGEYPAALEAYRSLALVSTRTPAPIAFRLALAQEALGEWEASTDNYRLAAAATDPWLVLAAQMGLGRIGVRLNSPEDSLAPLSDLLLRSSALEATEAEFASEARFLLGLAMTDRPNTTPPISPVLSEIPLQRLSIEWPVARTLAWLKQREADAAPSAERAAHRPSVSVRGVATQNIVVSADLPAVPAADLLERVAADRLWKVAWREGARRLAADRVVQVAMSDMPLAPFLTALLEPAGLAWRLDAPNLVVTPLDTLEPEPLTAYRQGLARQLLDGARRSFPTHPLAQLATLELGNQYFVEGHYEEASTMYGLLRLRGSTPVTIAAAFNRALAERHLGRLENARDSCYRIVDGSPSHPLTPFAFLSIGRLYLDAGQGPESILPLRRAFSNRSPSELRAAGLLHLALGHILSGHHRDAVNVLFENRGLVQPSPQYRNLAAFLLSYARLKTIDPDTDKYERESKFLLRALLSIEEDRGWLGPAGRLVIGRAYQQLEMYDEMAGIFTESLETASPPQAFALEMKYWIGEHAYRNNRIGTARKQFRELSQQAAAGPWRALARHRLAEFALRDQHADVCIEICRDLLHDPQLPEPARVLQLLGTAYERIGDLRRAAYCYAGDAQGLFRVDVAPAKAPAATAPAPAPSPTKPSPTDV